MKTADKIKVAKELKELFDEISFIFETMNEQTEFILEKRGRIEELEQYRESVRYVKTKIPLMMMKYSGLIRGEQEHE